MKNALALWLARFTPVRVAASTEEREAVYRLRYRVFIGELNRQFADIDHARQMMFSGDDEHPGSFLLYTGELPNITSTLRLRIWGPGQVPPREYGWYAINRFPGGETLTTGDIGRLAIDPGARGLTILPALLVHVYTLAVLEQNVGLLFCICSPGHVRYYRGLGMIPYGADLVETGAGPIQVPLVCAPSDAAWLRRCRSFLAPLAKKHFGRGRRAPLDTGKFRHILETEDVPVETEPARVWKAVARTFESGDDSAVFAGLSPRAVKALALSSLLMMLGEGQTLVRQGTQEKEVFIVLDGMLEVMQNERRVATLMRGELIGELAFFSHSGQRIATVRAVTKSRLLVLRRKFLRELTHKDPEAGFQLLMNMSRILAERLAKMPQD
jgi:hypothetical protein